MTSIKEITVPEITFYDLDNILKPRTRSWSPFTITTLMSLRHRNLPYTRVAISYPDIAPLLKSKNVPEHVDGDTPYTLPAIDLKSADGTVTTIMDSAAVAIALEELVPVSDAHPALFPLGVGTKETEAENALVFAEGKEERTKLRYFIIPHIPAILDERGAEYFHRTREQSFGKPLAEVAKEDAPDGELVPALEAAVAKFAEVWREHAGQEGNGPFFKGREQPCFVDFRVVGALEWWSCGRGDVVLEVLRRVDEGVMGKVYDGCKHLLF